MMMMWNSLLVVTAVVELALLISKTDGFYLKTHDRSPAKPSRAVDSFFSTNRRRRPRNSCFSGSAATVVVGGGGSRIRRRTMVSQEINMSDDDDEVVVEWIEDDEADEDEGAEALTATKTKKSSRWDNLNPKIKARIIKAAEERAIANKKKREPIHSKKRRMMMYVKEKQREKKNASRVKRPLSFKDRTPLSALVPGMEVSGVVISLTNFGAYVDVGTECDGLLHVSQLTQDFFVEHPRQVVSPGDEITCRVRSTEPNMKKLQLTMLSKDILDAEAMDQQDTDERIQLNEIAIDDELWGEIKRVTDYGCYVDVGCTVNGFLHFMDHPAFGWSNGEHPSQYMNVGQRVRVWVADIDTFNKQRIKLTANRPQHLPGPRREIY